MSTTLFSEFLSVLHTLPPYLKVKCHILNTSSLILDEILNHLDNDDQISLVAWEHLLECDETEQEDDSEDPWPPAVLTLGNLSAFHVCPGDDCPMCQTFPFYTYCYDGASLDQDMLPAANIVLLRIKEKIIVE